MYTLRETLHAINVLDEDIDISVDGYDTIAVVAPIKLSDDAMKIYAKALDLQVNDMTIIGDDEDLALAWDLLRSLAGYCPSDRFHKLFKIDSTEI